MSRERLPPAGQLRMKQAEQLHKTTHSSVAATRCIVVVTAAFILICIQRNRNTGQRTADTNRTRIQKEQLAQEWPTILSSSFWQSQQTLLCRQQDVFQVDSPIVWFWCAHSPKGPCSFASSWRYFVSYAVQCQSTKQYDAFW